MMEDNLPKSLTLTFDRVGLDYNTARRLFGWRQNAVLNAVIAIWILMVCWQVTDEWFVEVPARASIHVHRLREARALFPFVLTLPGMAYNFFRSNRIGRAVVHFELEINAAAILWNVGTNETVQRVLWPAVSGIRVIGDFVGVIFRRGLRNYLAIPTRAFASIAEQRKFVNAAEAFHRGEIPQPMDFEAGEWPPSPKRG